MHGGARMKVETSRTGGNLTDRREPFDLSTAVVGLTRTGEFNILDRGDGPPPRIDGVTVGAGLMTENDPHAGEMHPDGDELLVLISGQVHVLLEEEGADRAVVLQPGHAFVVPQGVWHQVLLQEPSHLFNVTPGPRCEYRALPEE
jgi:mannose-6-phosphate isomerase-like protein (cupin superfamily)